MAVRSDLYIVDLLVGNTLVDVDVYIWDSSGNMELIQSGHVPSISPDSGETISFNWDTGDKTGITKIIAVIDPENR